MDCRIALTILWLGAQFDTIRENYKYYYREAVKNRRTDIKNEEIKGEEVDSLATEYKTPDPELVAIGERIRIRREELHMSQEELGLAIGADKVAIHRYESGKVEMKCRTLQKIAKCLGTTTDALMGDKQENAPVDIRLLEACKGATGLDSASIEKICWMIQMTAAGAAANISTT